MTKPVHRDDVRRFLIGVVTVGLGASIAYVGITVQGGGELPLKSYTTVRAVFEDVGTLKPQQKVTEDGVRVGLVTDIAYVDGAARVTMRLDGVRPLYQDASAEIGNESALGKKFVDLDPGTAQAGPLGARDISSDRTRDARSLDDVLAAFDAKARRGLADGLQALGGGLQGHAADLRDATTVAPELLGDGRKVVATLADPATNLDDLLVTANDLAGQFEGRSATIAALLDEASTTLAAVNVEKTEALQTTLEELPAVLRTAQRGLGAINPVLDTTANAATRLRPGVEQLVRATPDLRGFLTESPPVARTVVKFTEEAEPALEALVPAVRDAKPLVDQLRTTFALADPFLTTLTPYWPDAGRLVSFHDLLSGHFSPTKHYFSAMLAFPGLYNVSLPDPTVDVDPYPGPGESFGPSYK